MLKWAAENELVSASVYHKLTTVSGLKRGRSEARETAPVLPVARAVVEETLPHLGPTVADMVRVQLETGMRPGELVIMRACDLDMSGTVWLYRPRRHKTEYHGHSRIVPIGPKVQAIVRRYLKTNLEAYLFSPADAREDQLRGRRERRATPMTPSQKARKRKRVQKKLRAIRMPMPERSRGRASWHSRRRSGCHRKHWQTAERNRKQRGSGDSRPKRRWN